MSERFPRVNLAEVEDVQRETLFYGMFYRGLTNKIVGPTGTGKTIFAVGALVYVLREEDAKPAHFDMEIGEGGSKSTYRGYGVTDEEFAQIHYVPFPEPRLTEADEFVRAILEAGEDFAVFDKKPDFLRSLGLEENNNDHQSEFYGRLIDPLREKVTSVILAPTGHAGDFGKGQRGRGGSESDFKCDTVWQLSVDTTFDREKVGRINFKCTKDRWGYIGVDRIVAFEIGGDGAGNIVLNHVSTGVAAASTSGRTEEDNALHKEVILRAARAIAPLPGTEQWQDDLFAWVRDNIKGKHGSREEHIAAVQRLINPADPTLQDHLVAVPQGTNAGKETFKYHFEAATG